MINTYIKYVLSKVLYNILCKNNIYKTNISDEEIEKIFFKIYEELDNLPDSYLSNIFYPILKKE